MRKITLATIGIVALLALGGFLYLSDPFNPERAKIEELADAFMEDITYKDFGGSARYHHRLEQDRVDIGRRLEELFLVDPEFIDIMDYRIVRSDLDSDGNRGRTLINIRFRPLKPDAVSDDEDDDIEEVETMLYWMKRHPECPLQTDCGGDEVCVDQGGEEVMRNEEPYAPTDPDDQPEEPFACDPDADHEWFMNLDTSLEQRDYQ